MQPIFPHHRAMWNYRLIPWAESGVFIYKAEEHQGPFQRSESQAEVFHRLHWTLNQAPVNDTNLITTMI